MPTRRPSPSLLLVTLSVALLPVCGAARERHAEQQQQQQQSTATATAAAAGAPLPEQNTTLTWEPMVGAQTYGVVLARDRALKDVVQRFETTSASTQHVVPRLAPGTYYFVAKGLSADKSIVGVTPPTPVVVGSVFEVTATRLGPSPPHLLAPINESRLPPERRIRFNWTRVPDTDGYRFRIWKEDESAEDGWRLLWSTQTEKTYLDLTDTPPGSYRYLASGRYRWQVACALNSTSGTPMLGDDTEGTFTLTRDVLLPTDDGGFRVSTGVGAFSYSGFSGTSRNATSLSGGTTSLAAEVQAWPAPRWGLVAGGSLTALKGASIGGILKEAHVEGAFRHLLSKETVGTDLLQGWTLHAGAGVGLRQDLQIDDLYTKSFPVNYGLRWRFDFEKRITLHWGLDVNLSGLLPLATYRGGGNNDPIGATTPQFLNGDLGLHATRRFGQDFKLSLGMQVVQHKSQYEQSWGDTTNTLRWFQGVGTFSFLF